MFVFAENINFLTADGVQFAHPLHHLGKSKKDLPLIAIDSFRHMYLFPGVLSIGLNAMEAFLILEIGKENEQCNLALVL